MLTRAAITNFRCLRDVVVRFEPLTVFVGPNASGKSAMLRALDPNLSIDPGDLWQRQETKCERTFQFDDGIEAHRTGQLRSGSMSWTSDRSWRYLTYQVLQLDPRELRQQNTLAEQTRFASDGSNLANFFATLGRREQERLAADFCRLVPVYRDVNSRPTSGGQHRLVYQDRWRDIWYEPHQVSDGSLIVLALLALQYQNPSIDLLAIEEIERGLHPYLIGEVLSTLRKMSRGEIGAKATQIVLATNSAGLLEFVEPKEVRFLSRNPDGSVTVEEAPTSAADWEQVLNEHQGSLGNLWLSGGLGGVPGGPGV
jgi:predicted ATPase